MIRREKINKLIKYIQLSLREVIEIKIKKDKIKKGFKVNGN